MRSDSMPQAQAQAPQDEFEHDEFHSSLEVDDTTGWRVYIVPALAGLFVIGALLITIFYGV